jgi:hypothetical protein
MSGRPNVASDGQRQLSHALLSVHRHRAEMNRHAIEIQALQIPRDPTR